MRQAEVDSTERVVAHDTQFVPSWSAPVDRTLLGLFERVTIEAGANILVAEVRTGHLPGRLLSRLPPSCRLMVVDSNSKMLDLARRRLEAAPQRIFYANQPLHALRYADGVFHAALCDAGLVTREDVARGGRELHRVLRDGGHLGLAFPTARTFVSVSEMIEESALRHALPGVEAGLAAFRAAVIEADEAPDLLAAIGLEVLAREQVSLSLSFDDAESFLFSPFTDLFLPRWLAICPDDAQRQKVFFDLVQSLNTYFAGLPIEVGVEVACALARKVG